MRQQLSFGVSGSFANNELIRTLTGNEQLVPDAFGQTNVSADYQLDTVSGNAGRARVGLETTLPLSDSLSLQIAGEGVVSPNPSDPEQPQRGMLFNDGGIGSQPARPGRVPARRSETGVHRATHRASQQRIRHQPRRGIRD
ncbi:MAG: hypothetical protein HC933_05490 [Pleurocapsa sp. SU_196_0]|nr:hypothetical protein [Pleurocapsa sp. SU_196_0]